MADQITASLAQAKILVMHGMRGEDGKSPYIGQNGNWIVWNGTDWVDTGVAAGVDESTVAAVVEDYLDEHPIQAPVQSVNGKTGAVVLDASDVGALPANTHIPDDAVWRGEWNVSTRYDVGDFVSYGGVIYRCNTGGIGIYPDEETGWDEWFGASNLGAYVKPSGGIPKTDLAQSVQTSLGKADTALQQHQSLAGYATETWVGQQIAAIPDELPAVAASDNGKFLRVVSGAWAAQAVPSAESSSFGGGS